MALRGLKVLEFAGLAPGPFCGKILADHGASVVRIDRLPTSVFAPDVLADNKRSLSLDLKNTDGLKIVRALIARSDVLIDPYRPGVMEKFQLGPSEALKENVSLIYARLSGFGQSGEWSQKAGHDINFLSLSGILSTLGGSQSSPTPPQNLLADFAGGGLLCALGILLALLERTKTGQGQVVDCSMLAGSAYIGSFLFHSKQSLPFISGEKRGRNLLDKGCPFYDTYETADHKYMAVGSLEPQFFERVVRVLNLQNKYSCNNQFDRSLWNQMRFDFEKTFRTKTRSEWVDAFANSDACVTPVLELEEAPDFNHNEVNGTFAQTESSLKVPGVAPKLSSSPGSLNPSESARLLPIGRDSESVLSELGYTTSEIHKLVREKVIHCVAYHSSKL